MNKNRNKVSMDPVQSRGPWTPGPCFVLTPRDCLDNDVVSNAPVRPGAKTKSQQEWEKERR